MLKNPEFQRTALGFVLCPAVGFDVTGSAVTGKKPEDVAASFPCPLGVE